MTYVTLDLSRRRVLSGAATLALGAIALGGAVLAWNASAVAAKSSQKSVSYQSHPKGGHSCNTCNAFQPPSACKTVEGDVESAGWCDKFTKR